MSKSSIGSKIEYSFKFRYTISTFSSVFWNIIFIYNLRFKHRNPEEVPGGFLTDCREDTLKEIQAMGDASIKSAKVYDKYQFERVGFFSVDPDTTESTVCIATKY